MKSFKPNVAIHPGYVLDNLLSSLGESQKWLSERTDLSEKHISEIINGISPITAETAVKLAVVFGGSANYWTNLDAVYKTNLANIKRRESAKNEIVLLKSFPYKELASRKWLPDIADKIERVLALCSFFGVSSLKSIPITQPVAFRRSNKKELDNYAIASWLRKGEKIARSIDNVPKFDKKRLNGSLEAIRQVIYDSPDDFLEKTSSVLRESGVILVTAEYLPRTYINGAARWIGHSPVIELSDRGKRDDVFWFTLFHEIGHILLHSKKEQFVDLDDMDITEQEKEADRFAENCLISEECYSLFLKENISITKKTIVDFSFAHKIKPSILCGRLKKEGRISQSSYADLHDYIHLSAR